MPYAIRVRLYYGDSLEADTDPDAAPGEPGAEVVPTLTDTQRALVELCQAMHGPDAQLMGFGELAMHAYGSMIRERAASAFFSYSQGYSVRTRVALGHRVEMWRAQVDIAVAR